MSGSTAEFEALLEQASLIHQRLLEEHLKVVHEAEFMTRQPRDKDAVSNGRRATQPNGCSESPLMLALSDAMMGVEAQETAELSPRALTREPVHGACAHDQYETADSNSEIVPISDMPENYQDDGLRCPKTLSYDRDKIERAFTRASYDKKDTERQKAERRIRARLGIGTTGEQEFITADILLAAVTKLGISTFSEDDMRKLIHRVLSARARLDKYTSADRVGNFIKSTGSRVAVAVMTERKRGAVSGRTVSCIMDDEENGPQRDKSMSYRSSKAGLHFAGGFLATFPLFSWRVDDPEEAILFQDLMDAFFGSDVSRCLHPQDITLLNTVSEILSSGNVNAVISELADVKLDDLASPPPCASCLEVIEPIVAFLIMMNGILLGIQTDSSVDDWRGWLTIEYVFVAIFTVELCFRVWYERLCKFLAGSEAGWNCLDAATVLVGWMEIILEESWNGQVLRLARLTRLARLLRVIHFRGFRDLQLMLKGLLGGFRTLGWAMVILFSSIYMISLFLISTVAKTQVLADAFPTDAEEFFGTVPRCMFTSFRCFTGDCTNSDGVSMIPVLSRSFGEGFTIVYTIAMVLITFGVFNLIMAIYIEATLSAAKQREACDRVGKARETLKAAHVTKRLVKRICTLHRVFDRLEGSWCSEQPMPTVDFVNDFDDIDDISLRLTRAMFAAMADDKYVQQCLDDLGVARGTEIFDVLDADGNGVLELVELISGVLRMRGEPSKSDVLACILSIRALQSAVNRVREEMQEGFRSSAGQFQASMRKTKNLLQRKNSSVDSYSTSHLVDVEDDISPRGLPTKLSL